MAQVEIPLTGGDVTEGVVRVGDTVRRPIGEHSPLVHVVLRHLEAVGFEGAPRFLRLDHRGREVLTFVEGEVAGRPWPSWVADQDRAASVARLLRRLDDAMVPLGLPIDACSPTRLAPLPTDEPADPAPSFLGHLDVTPENTIFRDGEAFALIDFDLVRPATRVDSVGNLLLWWAGWMPVEDREPVMRGIEATTRGRLLVDAYGLDPELRAHVLPVAIRTAGRSWHRMRDRAARLGGGWARMWDEGIGDQIRRREQWLVDNDTGLAEALCR